MAALPSALMPGDRSQRPRATLGRIELYGSRPTSRTNRMEPQGFFMLGRQRKSCLDFVSIAARSPNICSVGLAKPGCRFDERIEHRLQVERRPADDLEHVSGGRLLLKRFAQLVKQPRVL